ncbi:hypothetical protein JTB14_035885 [Gonioctena quinquepunctata]|nr:hypothetical protein JTB14_035885 [Gonioctena quinquepunctata]
MQNSLITDYGYPLEIHDIETEDGYILKAHRIPSNNGQINNSTNKYPVLILHGLGGGPENFVWMGPNTSLAFLLADDNYDVWLISARGTWHSEKHITLNPDEDVEFWQFSWHEIGIYDTTAAIDYILKNTNKKSLHYVGHSQGTTTLFVMGSERQAYNDKIRVMIALGPGSGYLWPTHPLIKLVEPISGYIQVLLELLKIYRVPPYMSVSTLHTILHFFCGHRFSPVYLCKNVLFLFVGFEHRQFDTKRLPLFTSLAPAGCSTKQCVHYLQNIKKEVFQKYDYGEEENLKIYGVKKPPAYDLSRVTFPVALFTGANDWYASKKGVDNLITNLPNVVETYEVSDKEWTHGDMIWGRDVRTLLNEKVLKVMEKYK